MRHIPRSPSRSTAGPRAVGVVVVVVVLSLLGAACTADEGEIDAGPKMVAATASDVFRLPIDSRFEPGPCPINPTTRVDVAIQCGTLRVPEKRDQPDGNQVDLAVMILRSTSDDPSPDPIVYLEGGPGGSALVNLQRWIDPVTPLLDQRDVILLDQRGTGFSSPSLACDEEFEDASLFSTSAEVLGECIARLDEAGVDRSAYTTFENAADLKDLREALGLESWNLYGVSYGTRLALAAMATDPDGIRSVVLDSTYPLTVDLYSTLPANGHRSFLAVFEACAADPDCNSAYPDLENRFYETIRNMDAAPQVVKGVHPANGTELSYLFDGATLVSILYQALYLPEVIPDVPEAIDEANKGNAQAIWDLLVAPVFPDPDEVARYQRDALDLGQEGFPSSITDGMHLSVQCTEEVPFTDDAAVEAQARTLPPEVSFALLQSVLGMQAQCAIWNVPAHDAADLQGLVNRSIPTLILAGSFDPITPPEWGRIAADQLDNVTYLEIDGIGHAVIGGGECAGNLISSYIDDPATFDQTMCTIEPPDFTD